MGALVRYLSHTLLLPFLTPPPSNFYCYFLSHTLLLSLTRASSQSIALPLTRSISLVGSFFHSLYPSHLFSALILHFFLTLGFSLPLVLPHRLRAPRVRSLKVGKLGCSLKRDSCRSVACKASSWCMGCIMSLLLTAPRFITDIVCCIL